MKSTPRLLCCLLPLLTGYVAHADPVAKATAALERGDFDSALRLLPAKSAGPASEAIRARVFLARGQLAEAERATAGISPKDPSRLQLAWYLARAKGKSTSIREASERLCRTGDPTGRACVDAEFHARERPATEVELAADTELRMAEEAPFPVILGETSAGKTGLIVDTGASETVITRAYAERLGVQITENAFPVGVAGGGAHAFAQLGMLDSLRLGKVLVRNLPVLVVNAPELDAQQLPIVLSPQQAFAGLVVSFDFERSRLGLARNRAPLAGERVTTFDYVTAGLDLAVPASFGEGPAGLFGLDTGHAGSCVLSTSYYAGEPAAPGKLLQGAGASYAAAAAKPKPFTVGGLELQPSRPCSLTPMFKTGIQLAGLLGNDLWRGGVLVLDTVKRKVTLRLAAATVPR